MRTRCPCCRLSWADTGGLSHRPIDRGAADSPGRRPGRPQMHVHLLSAIRAAGHDVGKDPELGSLPPSTWRPSSRTPRVLGPGGGCGLVWPRLPQRLLHRQDGARAARLPQSRFAGKNVLRRLMVFHLDKVNYLFLKILQIKAESTAAGLNCPWGSPRLFEPTLPG